MFHDLIARGLDPSAIQPGIMDGLPGPEKAFLEAFRKANVQRCKVNKAVNVITKVRRKDRKIIAQEMRKVFYAADQLGAKRALKSFSGKWKAIYPDAVRCLEKGFDAMIAYLEFPEEEWLHLRTTNLIERLNKEFKRRTKPMEIVAGEASVYTLLAFVAMKM